MAWYSDTHGEPMYVSNGDARFYRDAIFYQDPAPVSFRTPPIYNDVYYYRSFRDQKPIFSRAGELLPAREQVHIRREDPYPYPYPTAPWWPKRDYPHYPVWVVERPRGDDEEDSVLEFYAPQLCSGRRERKVVDALKAFPGVVNVFADQWEKKVVVVGSGLRAEHVLRRLQVVPHMERCVFWRDR